MRLHTTNLVALISKRHGRTECPRHYFTRVACRRIGPCVRQSHRYDRLVIGVASYLSGKHTLIVLRWNWTHSIFFKLGDNFYIFCRIWMNFFLRRVGICLNQILLLWSQGKRLKFSIYHFFRNLNRLYLYLSWFCYILCSI